MIRVGLALPMHATWQGGQNYFHNLLGCFHRYPDADLRLEIFTESPLDFVKYECEGIHVNDCPATLIAGAWQWPRRGLNRLLRYDPLMLHILKRNRIDLLSHFNIGEQRTVKTLPWQADFQHRVMPKFFDQRNRQRRDVDVRKAALWGDILLSSESAEKDFRRFFPELSGVRTHVLHFCSVSVLSIPPMSREELSEAYPVQEPYFYLPNQFWQHKNHGVVVEALRQLPAEIRVICTGAMEDTRNPSYVPSLMEKVKQAGLENRFVCLGAVKYRVVVSLMHHSIALLQPSVSEGWSTMVEEAKALCKAIVLSNIDVHLEQAPPRGHYFHPDSAEELAAQMKRVHAEYDPGVEQKFAEQRLQYEGKAQREFSANYARIIKLVAGPGTD